MVIENKTKGRNICLDTMKKSLLRTNQDVFSRIAFTKFYLVVFALCFLICIKFRGNFMLLAAYYSLIFSFKSKWWIFIKVNMEASFSIFITTFSLLNDSSYVIDNSCFSHNIEFFVIHIFRAKWGQLSMILHSNKCLLLLLLRMK